MDKRPDPVADADPAARQLARDLMAEARHAALAVVDAESGFPGISRIAFGLDDGGCPLTLISALAPHFAAMRTNPVAAVMVGEPGPRGDPLTHPRLMIRVRPAFVLREGAEHERLRTLWLARNPKAKPYVDLGDFAFVRLHPLSALLNAGFGRAARLTPADLIG